MTKQKPFIKYIDISNFFPESQVVISDYICTLCNGVYNQPYMDSCGHVFCNACLETQMENSSGKCPINNQIIIRDKICPINFLTQIIAKQSITCVNKDKGCDWSGKFLELEDHLGYDCKKHFIKCKHEKCTKMVLREDHESHELSCEYKPEKCEYCNIEIPKIEMIIHLDDICPNILVECPQKCDEMIERCKLNYHNTVECENILNNCHYKIYGCEDKFFKKEMNKHLEINHEKHNLLLLSFFNNFQIGFLDRLSKLETSFKNYSDKIVNIEKQLKGKNGFEMLKHKRERERDHKNEFD